MKVKEGLGDKLRGKSNTKIDFEEVGCKTVV
jgi:hypothetical protein